MQWRGDEQALSREEVGATKVLVGFAFQQELEPFWRIVRQRAVRVLPGNEVRAGARGRVCVSPGGLAVQEGPQLVRRHSRLWLLPLARSPKGEAFVLRPRERILIHWGPRRDSAAGLVAPDLGSPQGGEGGDWHIFVDVPRVPTEGGGSAGLGPSVEQLLKGVEGFATRLFKPLSGVAGEPVCGLEEGALAIRQDDGVVGDWDELERVDQAPEFGQVGIGRAVNSPGHPPPRGAPSDTCGERAVQARAVGDHPPAPPQADPLAVEIAWRGHTQRSRVFAECVAVVGAGVREGEAGPVFRVGLEVGRV